MGRPPLSPTMICLLAEALRKVCTKNQNLVPPNRRSGRRTYVRLYREKKTREATIPTGKVRLSRLVFRACGGVCRAASRDDRGSAGDKAHEFRYGRERRLLCAKHLPRPGGIGAIDRPPRLSFSIARRLVRVLAMEASLPAKTLRPPSRTLTIYSRARYSSFPSATTLYIGVLLRSRSE